MQQTPTQLPEIKLVGITCRMNNSQIFQSDPSTNIIATIVQKYFYNGLSEKMADRSNPGTTYCVYTHYESDFMGDYTYFIGEAVTTFEKASAEFEMLTIPPQTYAKITPGPGPMPDVCVDAWQKIWALSPTDFGGERGYIADFEIYDGRSHNPQNTTLDIYIGLRPPA